MFPRRLLWIDGLAAASAGLIVLLLRGWLVDWYSLPAEFLLLIGAVNLLYSLYSLPLALLSRRPRLFILFLVIANLTWATLCIVWSIYYAATASVFGMIHLIGEGLFVAILAGLEWHWRDQLSTT